MSARLTRASSHMSIIRRFGPRASWRPCAIQDLADVMLINFHPRWPCWRLPYPYLGISDLISFFGPSPIIRKPSLRAKCLHRRWVSLYLMRTPVSCGYGGLPYCLNPEFSSAADPFVTNFPLSGKNAHLTKTPLLPPEEARTGPRSRVP